MSIAREEVFSRGFPIYTLLGVRPFHALLSSSILTQCKEVPTEEQRQCEIKSI